MYNMEIDKIIKEIKKNNAKLVCLNLPDGLKPKAEELQKKILEDTDAEVEERNPFE